MILDPQGQAKRHERRSSKGGALYSVGGTTGRDRQPSTIHAGRWPPRVDRERKFGQMAEVPEEDGLGRQSG